MRTTPKEKAIQLCDIIHHSSMGDGWGIFIKSRAHKIADEVITSLDKDGNSIIFWLDVKEEIDKLQL